MQKIKIFLWSVLASGIPVILSDLGLVNTKYSVTCYIIFEIGFVLSLFFLLMIGTKRIFSNFLVFIGLSLVITTVNYLWYNYYYLELTRKTFDSPVFAVGVIGIFIALFGYWLHSFLNIGVALKNDAKTFKDDYDRKMKEEHDPEGLR